MKIWYNSIIDTDRHVVEIRGDRVSIGRSTKNDIVLDSPYIAEEAAVLNRTNGTWELTALGINGLVVKQPGQIDADGDRRVAGGERFSISESLAINLYPYTLSLDLPAHHTNSRNAQRGLLDERMSLLIRDVHVELLRRIDLTGDAPGRKCDDDEYLLRLERTIDEIVKAHEEFTKAAMIDHLAGHGMRDALIAQIAGGSQPTSNTGTSNTGLYTLRHWSRLVSSVPDRENEIEKTAEYLEAELIDEPALNVASQIDLVERDYWESWCGVDERLHEGFKQYLALRYLKKEVKDIVFGYGPLEDLLRLPTVSEIMVVDRERIYVERNGVLQNSGRRFVSDTVIESIIQRIVANVGRRIDKSQPLVDARLSDGSRVNAVIAPLAVSGPTLTIRKFPANKLLIDDLVAKGAMSRTVAEFLRAIVLNHRNILISGGTGTGKTTLLNCLSDFIPDKERIVTVEDTAELQLAKQHVVRLETKDANVEGAGEYTIRDLVKNALRMRPDRIVVGECRGPEALDMLQAMNTGHDGSLTTIHANNARDVALRLEVLVQMAADLPVESIRQQVGSAIDMVVQLKRLRDGRRVISQISEVVGVNNRTGQLEIRDLFLLSDPDAENAQAAPTGRLPTFIGDLISSGNLELDTFYQ